MNKKLYEARKKRGLTQQEVAERVGIDRTHYVRIENGSRTPSLGVARKIASVFGMPIEEIFFPESVA